MGRSCVCKVLIGKKVNTPLLTESGNQGQRRSVLSPFPKRISQSRNGLGAARLESGDTMAIHYGSRRKLKK